jgi:hypothetical protein
MFDKAVRGLASQGWERCVTKDGKCTYHSAINGKEAHCAWGWVDPGAENGWGQVSEVATYLPGSVAAHLNKDDLQFALRMQKSHDGHPGEDWYPGKLRDRLVEFAKKEQLTWPEGA